MVPYIRCPSRLPDRLPKKTIYFSVRDFAQSSPRLGSIEANSGFEYSSEVGREIHAAIQAQRSKSDKNYTAEVKVKAKFSRANYLFAISGRIDGLYAGAPKVIEEIKTTFDLRSLKQALTLNPEHPYILQLKTYAYLLDRQTLIAPEIRFLLVSGASKREESFSISYAKDEYEKWLNRRLDALVEEAIEIERQEARRREIAKSLRFPFKSLRANQEKAISFIAENIAKKKFLLVQAPTGSGKTLALIYPSLSDALLRGQQTIYATAKNSQHRNAENALNLLRQSGAEVKSLTLTAKSKVCLKSEQICDPGYCEFAKDHFTKVHEHQLVAKLSAETHLSANRFQEIGKEYQVCPFELATQMIKTTDVVVCDYNYIFSPRSLIELLSKPEAPKESQPVLLVDEAHNLPERARSYFSPSMETDFFIARKHDFAKLPFTLSIEGGQILSQAITAIRDLMPANKSFFESLIALKEGHFEALRQNLSKFTGRALESDIDKINLASVLNTCHYISTFLSQADGIEDNCSLIGKRNKVDESLTILCLDASQHLQKAYARFANCLFFSATLKPFDYAIAMLGIDSQAFETIELESDFPEKNRKIMILPTVSTAYKDREANYRIIAKQITQVLNSHSGNYFVFFPSFDFLERVALELSLEDTAIIVQGRAMTALQTDSILTRFMDGKNRKIVLCVQGGSFAEGFDLPNGAISGAIIVGPAVPKYDLERKILQDYYEKQFRRGSDFAFTYPAMTKVVQAAGRVIRSETDIGLIVLMDKRFVANNYAQAMPSDWFDASPRELIASHIDREVASFWAQAAVNQTI
ncbi:unnamed protein product [Sphagnum balticum]